MTQTTETRRFNFRAYRDHRTLNLGHHESLHVEIKVTETDDEVITAPEALPAMWGQVRDHVKHIEHAYGADNVIVYEDGDEVRL